MTTELDTLTNWLETNTDIRENDWTPTKELHAAYVDVTGSRISIKIFVSLLKSLGVDHQTALARLSLRPTQIIDTPVVVSPPANNTVHPKTPSPQRFIRPGDVAELTDAQIQEIFTRPRPRSRNGVTIVAKGSHGALINLNSLRKKLG